MITPSSLAPTAASPETVSSWAEERNSSLLCHWMVTFKNAKGAALDERVFTYERPSEEPERRLLSFRERSGEIEIALTFSSYAPLELRPDGSPTRILTLAPAPLGEAAGSALTYYPSAGSSPAVRQLQPSLCRCWEEGTIWQSPEGILDGYLAGAVNDLDLVLGTLRLARFKGLSLKPRFSFDNTVHSPPAGVTRLTPLNAKEKLASPEDDDHVVSSVSMIPVPPPEKPFLRAFRRADGCGAVVRRTLDAVDVGCFFLSPEGPMMIFKKGIRPALIAESLLSGGSAGQRDGFAYEGIAESLEGELTLEDISQRAAQGIREEVGIEPRDQPRFIGWAYPSPETNPERAYNFLAQVDPADPSHAAFTLDERVEVFYAAASDIISLFEGGTIRDPRLALNAYLLDLCYRRETSGS